MLAAADISLIPDAFQLGQILCLLCGELTCLLQHGFPHLFTIGSNTTRVHFEGFEENILLGEHDAQKILQALPVMIGGIHMDMDAAGIVDLSLGVPHLPDTLLKFGQFRIG